ncbi:putative DNA-binding transcriptional regulator AlpA [Mesorhizobium jarvisii]
MTTISMTTGEVESHALFTAGTAPLTIPDFCRRHQISRSSYYALKASGRGPREYVIGKLVRISAEAEVEWVRRLEAAGRDRAQTAA